jgi:hypothetical protein
MRWIIGPMLAIASGGSAAPPPMTGDWVVTTDRIPLMLIHVGQMPNGDAGTVVRPQSMGVGAGQAFDSIEGPVITQRIGKMHATGDAWELTLVPRKPSEHPPVLTMRVDVRGKAQLGWKGAGFGDVQLYRAPAGTRPWAKWDNKRTYYADAEWTTNPEMTAMFEADQADRAGGPAKINWAEATIRDKAHRVRTRQMLDAGALASGDDYFHAAFIFQHGDEPASYLLAHVLATTAVARGRRDAAWIAAATLDRYLQSIGQMQVYGTQYMTPPHGPPTQEPYDRRFMSDALRLISGVQSQVDQEKRRAQMEALWATRNNPTHKP